MTQVAHAFRDLPDRQSISTLARNRALKVLTGPAQAIKVDCGGQRIRTSGAAGSNWWGEGTSFISGIAGWVVQCRSIFHHELVGAL